MGGGMSNMSSMSGMSGMSGGMSGPSYSSSLSSSSISSSTGQAYDYNAIPLSIMAGMSAGGPVGDPTLQGKGVKGGMKSGGSYNSGSNHSGSYITSTDDGVSSNRHKPYKAKGGEAPSFHHGGNSNDRHSSQRGNSQTNPYL